MFVCVLLSRFSAIICLERADLLALLCVMFSCVLVYFTFPNGVPVKHKHGQYSKNRVTYNIITDS